MAIALFSSYEEANGAEFLIRDEVYTFADSDCGFRFWFDFSRTPQNWHSPHDYWNGKIYTRFEVIEQPTNTPLKMSFIMWHDRNHNELAGKHNYISGGPGSVGTAEEILRTYYVMGNGIDLTSRDNLWRMGVDVRNSSGQGIACPAWGYPEDIWATRANYYPLKVRFTIVAVSAGSSFSGWSNYVSGEPVDGGSGGGTGGGGTGGTDPTPKGSELSIEGEDMTMSGYTTDGTVPNSSMNEVAKLTGTSGNLSANFPHTNGNYDIEINYVAESDGQIPYSVELNGSTIDSWTTSLSSTTFEHRSRTINNVNIYNGDDITINGTKNGEAWARIDYIDFTRNGDITAEPPSYTIDYQNERTAQTVSSAFEYSANQSSWTSGTGSYVALTPGQDMYFRPKTSPSSIQTLDVPSRPAASISTSIDYINERTNSSFSSSYEYSTNSNFGSATTCTGSSISLNPGTDIYIRQRATSSAFASNAFLLDVPSRPSAPVVSINYSNENTSSIASTVEYSSSSNFSSTTSGTGSSVSLSPGNDLYFRTKATASSFASQTRFLDVPNRPATPNFTINYAEERTVQIVSSEYSYASASDMSGAVLGTGSYIDLTPGSNRYFRRNATSSSFRSAVQTLSVPSRPATPSFSIDFANETTVENVSSNYEYSASASFASKTSGINQQVVLTPGSNIYFRHAATSSAFQSGTQTLTVPGRPAAPSYSIDYVNEQTSAAVPTSVEYATQANFANANTGQNARVSLTPGANHYFRQKATASTFASSSFHLVVPQRPIGTSYTIDYANESTNENVSATVEYGSDASFNGSSSGANAKVNLTPGSNLYFRVKATASTFASNTQELNVPSRPSAPSFDINFFNETTEQTVSAETLYSLNDDMSNASAGEGKAVGLTPGETLYFKKEATANSFASETFELIVPNRPIISTSETKQTDSNPIPMSVDFGQSVTGFELGDLSITNGSAENLAGSYTFDLYPEAKGKVTIYLLPDVVAEGNFRAETFNIEFTGDASSVDQNNQIEFTLRPNPAQDHIFITVPENSSVKTVSIKDYSGRTVMNSLHISDKLDISSLRKGYYIISVYFEDGSEAHETFIKSE